MYSYQFIDGRPGEAEGNDDQFFLCSGAGRRTLSRWADGLDGDSGLIKELFREGSVVDTETLAVQLRLAVLASPPPPEVAASVAGLVARVGVGHPLEMVGIVSD